MQNNFSSPMANYYRNQMNGISSPMSYTPQYTQTLPQMTQQTTTSNNFPCRPVTSIEEARAAIIDNAYVPYVFTNFGSNEIYTKHILNDGTAKLNKYILAPETQPITPVSQEVPSFDIEQMKSQIENLNVQVIQLNQEIVSLKQGGKKEDAESNKSSSNTKSSK